MTTTNNKFIDPTGKMAESTLRIQDLAQVEKKLVLLIETASEALSILSDDAPTYEDNTNLHDRAQAFRALAQKYFSLVNDIQFSLKSHTHYLTQEANITSSTTKNTTIPFKTSVAAQYKELEIWTGAIETIRQRIEEIKKIALEEA